MKMIPTLEGTPMSAAEIDLRIPETRPSERTGDTDMTKALLREAMSRLQEAERIIAEQEKQIRALQDEVSTDPMTGLMNRRGFQDLFEQELSRIQRGTSQGAVLVMIDLDGFKAINDTHGHQAGDECLKQVAEKVNSTIRITDGAARFGGDEFAILLTQTDPKKVGSRINSIRKALNSVAFKWEDKELKCGGSLGTASVTAEGSDFASAYKVADERLYNDKAARKATVAPKP